MDMTMWISLLDNIHTWTLLILIILKRTACAREQDLVCEQTICLQEQTTLKCNDSLILIRNVTTSSGVASDVTFNSLKRLCMGKNTCSTAAVCHSRHAGPLVVNYMCVYDLIENRGCHNSSSVVNSRQGFLQSPGYPAATDYHPCHWRIIAQPSAAVHLILHDLVHVVPQSKGKCEGGLVLQAQTCDSPRRPFTRMLCANENAGVGSADEWRVVLCGTVNLQLQQGKDMYPLRFWISFTVRESLLTQPIPVTLSRAGLASSCRQVPSTTGSALQVPSVIMTTETMTSLSGARPGEEGNKDSTLTILIAMVCVIGSIAVILSVILIVICIRRRRPKVELTEHVYADPGQCDPKSYTFTGQGTHSYRNGPLPAPPRPKLNEQYSDVVDAVTSNAKPTAPTSPGYAEVEEVPGINNERCAKRFQFLSKQQPSLTSISASSAYEDINPCASTDKQQKLTPTEKDVYVHVLDTAAKHVFSASADLQGRTEPEKSASVKEEEKHKSSTVLPLANRYNAIVAKSSDSKPGGKIGSSSTRLYPLQEGRVASLISTLSGGRNASSSNS